MRTPLRSMSECEWEFQKCLSPAYSYSSSFLHSLFFTTPSITRTRTAEDIHFETLEDVHKEVERRDSAIRPETFEIRFETVHEGLRAELSQPAKQKNPATRQMRARRIPKFERNRTLFLCRIPK